MHYTYSNSKAVPVHAIDGYKDSENKAPNIVYLTLALYGGGCRG
jgi:hypothetical protein